MGQDASDRRLPSIFVSVASYRDSQCQYTLQDLFEKASRPERVVVGVCHQVSAEDADCFLLDLDRWARQIRVCFLPHAEAKGPCHARALIQQRLLLDEAYYFQVDSHCRFARGWDELLLEQLAACPSPRPVLTTLGSSYELPRDHRPGADDDAVLSRRSAMMVLCADKFGDDCPGQDDSFLRIKNRACRTDFGHIPPPSLFWTARFHFSSTEAARECPYDPYLEYVFFGEEISMAARLYTHGWDLFNPTRTIGYHLQSRFHRPFYTEVQVTELSVRRHRHAKARLYRLLGDEQAGSSESPAPAPGPPYGLGSARALEAYERYCGVSFRAHAVSDRARRGGVGAELLAPSWAEEARGELLSAQCFADPEVWAGRGNAEALVRQFPEALAPRGPSPAVVQAREFAASEVKELRAQALRGPAVSLELSRRCARLARLSAEAGDSAAAREAHAEALELASSAEAAAAGTRSTALWRGSVSAARACALCGLGLAAEAMAAAKEALNAARQALRAEAGEAPELLALEAVCWTHRAHERADDKAGLAGALPELAALLGQLRARWAADRLSAAALGSEQEQVQVLLPATLGPPPQVVETTRAKLLEVVLQAALVPGNELGDSIAWSVFTDFGAEVRASSRLQRQLGMLQAGGLFLELSS